LTSYSLSSHLRSLAAAPTLALLAISPSAHTQDTPPPNAALLLKELDQIASGAKNKLESRRADAISQLQSAASSGSSSVEFTLRALEYAKYPDRHSDFLDWRHKNEELLRSISFQNAALFQLRYLLLALKRSEQHDAYAQVQETLTYLNDLSAQKSLQKVDLPDNSRPKDQSSDRPRQEALDFIQHPLHDLESVKYLLIGDLLPKGDDFEDVPGNYQGIMEKNIRLPLRTKKDPRLISTWDTQIAKESVAITATGSAQLAESFNQIRLPELLFKKALDTSIAGQPNRSLSEVIALIHNYPLNPSVKDWVEYARGEIAKMTPPMPTAAPSLQPLPSPASITPSSSK
jgi:hypothetical protein